MKEFAKLLLILVAIIATSQTTYAQKKYTYFSIGAMVGTTHYLGDLDDNGFEMWRNNSGFHFSSIRPSLGINLGYHFDPHMYVRVGFNQGWYGGADSLSDDQQRKERNLHFKSALTEFTGQLVYEFFATDLHYEHRPKWTPYIFAGISAFHFNPKAQANADWVQKYPDVFGKDPDEWFELKPLGTEGQTLPDAVRKENEGPEPYGLTQISIPMGIGVRYTVNKKFNLHAEITLRKTFTDYLDDVSGSYVNPTDLLNYTSNGEVAFLFADRSVYANYGVGREGVFNNPLKNENNEQSIFKGAYGGNSTGAISQRGNPNDKDWYGFFQIGFSYILDSGAKCPRFKKQY